MLAACYAASLLLAFTPARAPAANLPTTPWPRLQSRALVRCSEGEQQLPPGSGADKERPRDPEEVARKFGLEAGLFSALRSKAKGTDQGGADGGVATAGDLLKRYGGAYLLTSTSLALVSFSICYLLVSNGVDVSGLLGNFGIKVGEQGSKVGTVGLAYAIHKAASPIRFPPTVALTPVVAAKLFGKREDGVAAEDESTTN